MITIKNFSTSFVGVKYKMDIFVKRIILLGLVALILKLMKK